MGVDAEVLWTYPETGPSSPSISAGATRTLTAQYPNSGSGSTSSAVDFWTDLTATTDYLANDSADGSGTNRTSSISVSLTKRAQSMDIALTNGHSGAVYITKLQAQGHKITTKIPSRCRPLTVPARLLSVSGYIHTLESSCRIARKPRTGVISTWPPGRILYHC